MTVNREHVEAVARALVSQPWPEGTLGEWANNQRAERLLTSTDPAVHVALAASLPDSVIEAEALRRFYPARHLTGLSDD